ncbi:MAG: DinB family protein [Dehalococcoidia bacterium]
MTRSPEAGLYVAQLEWLLMQLHDALGHIPEGMLGWAPHEGANPARVIARHAMAVTSVYVLGFGCGADAFMERDRAAEFLDQPRDPSPAHGHELSAAHYALLDLIGDIRRHLEPLTEADMARTCIPPQHLWGTGAPRQISAREAIVEAIRHGAIHLGELRLTMELAQRAQADGGRA